MSKQSVADKPNITNYIEESHSEKLARKTRESPFMLIGLLHNFQKN